jgi:hypothetical protein
MVDREALAGGAQVDVEAVLGDVDADEQGSGGLVHDPVSPDAGCRALVTVRVARTRPAGRRVLARPRWTHGTAGSRRPARSRYRIGSCQHTNGRVEPRPIQTVRGRRSTARRPARHHKPRRAAPGAAVRVTITGGGGRGDERWVVRTTTRAGRAAPRVGLDRSRRSDENGGRSLNRPPPRRPDEVGAVSPSGRGGRSPGS